MDISQIQHGIVCFTFDDARYADWLTLIPMFEKYNARMTFFFDKEITPEVVCAMNELKRHRHAIGLHTLRHTDAPEVFAERGGEAYLEEEILPQLNVCRNAGLDIRNFAYPNNRNTPESDAFLSEKCGFTRFRAQMATPYQKGHWIAAYDCVFYPLDKIATSRALAGPGIGSYYGSMQENLDAALERAANENRMIVFFSHGISMTPGLVDVSTPMLEHTLQKACALEMTIASFDELP